MPSLVGVFSVPLRLARPLAICLLVGVAFLTSTRNAAGDAKPPNCHDHAVIVFDASGSMDSSRQFSRRIDIARLALEAVLPDIARDRPTGLVTYSGSVNSSCDDIQLRVPPALNTSKLILKELSRLDPSGPTALSAAVNLAAETLQRLATSGVVVLITDGHETCGRDVCRLARQLARSAPGITVHTIGFRLEGPGTEELLCLSEQTSGTHTTTRDFSSLRTALEKTLSCPRLSERS